MSQGFGAVQVLDEHEHWYWLLPHGTELGSTYAVLGFRVELFDNGAFSIRWGEEVGAWGVADIDAAQGDPETTHVEDMAAERICQETAATLIDRVDGLVGRFVGLVGRFVGRVERDRSAEEP